MRHEAKSKREHDRTAEAIRTGDRVALARAITLIESAKPEDQTNAQALVEQLLPYTGKSVRVGISGVPGAGKSTLIDQLGLNLVAQGHKVAVLAVDPTSSRSGGSILGDKTRMGRLATEPSAFIRPSPAGDSLGGVTKTMRETIALAEAADYDVVLVETVGVGQSEISVANMVDIFVVVVSSAVYSSLPTSSPSTKLTGTTSSAPIARQWSTAPRCTSLPPATRTGSRKC
jgi:LAO/AO transport system kinase